VSIRGRPRAWWFFRRPRTVEPDALQHAVAAAATRRLRSAVRFTLELTPAPDAARQLLQAIAAPAPSRGRSTG
jgi:hypothetical protein